MTRAWRVCHLPGRHTNETHSHTAPGLRTAPAPPVTPVAAAHQGPENLSEGGALTSASNWNDHRIVSHHRTVSSRHLVVSWIFIFSIPIKSQSLWEMRQVQVFATFSDGRRMTKKTRKMKEQRRKSRWSLAGLLLCKVHSAAFPEIWKTLGREDDAL